MGSEEKLRLVNRVLTKEINIVLKINNSSSSTYSTDRRERTGDLSHSKINWVATLQLKEFLKKTQKDNKRKHLRGSGETTKEKRLKENGGEMKRQVDVIREFKTGKIQTDQI